MKTRNKGLILSFVGVLILSPDSLFIRLVNLDDFSLNASSDEMVGLL